MRWTSPTASQRRDRRIAEGLRVGDERAVADLHALYGRTVFGYLVQALGERPRAEDVFQQVLVEVWRRGPQFDPRRGSLLGWVMTIARSRAIDERRRRTPEPRDPDRLAPQIAPGADPAALVDAWTVAALLERLPLEESALLRMRFHEDLSQTEIAQRTGLALGTVKTRMVRGLRRLRTLVEAEFDDVATPQAEPVLVAGGVPAGPGARL